MYYCVNCGVTGHWAGQATCPINEKENDMADKRAQSTAQKQQMKHQSAQRIPSSEDFNRCGKETHKGPALGHQANSKQHGDKSRSRQKKLSIGEG